MGFNRKSRLRKTGCQWSIAAILVPPKFLSHSIAQFDGGVKSELGGLIMFESRLQTAQACLFLAGILEGVAILTFIFGSIAVAIFLLVVSHAGAALGNYFYADSKGYPPLIGIPLGVGFGVASAVIYAMLPDETVESTFASDRRLAAEGVKNARKRDKGYEVLDDDDDD